MNNQDHDMPDLMRAVVLNNFKEMTAVMKQFSEDETNVNLIIRAADLMIDSLSGGGKIIACGNGGSMCDATHFCEELLARFRNNRAALPAIAISDPSYITCVGNDFGFDQIFSRFVQACGKPGDVLLAISTSGNSENVVNAAKTAKDAGMKVVALTGKPNAHVVKYSDVELRTPITKYSDRSQEIHTKIIHTLVQLIEIGMGLAVPE